MIKEILDRRTLRRMAGARSFERGDDYFAHGHVRAVVEHEGTITARVRGTRPYRVKLRVEGGDLAYSCTCPVGADGAFCKHCVAVGLAWLEPGEITKAPEKKPAKPAVTMDDVRTYLAGQDKSALVDMLMEQAIDHDRLRQRLLMRAAKRGPRGLNIATYRQAIDDAVDQSGFVDYHEAYDYARGEAGADSDIDLLVDFSRVVTLFEFVRLQRRLSEVLRRRVDLVTRAALKPQLRARILAEAVRAA